MYYHVDHLELEITKNQKIGKRRIDDLDQSQDLNKYALRWWDSGTE